MCCAARRSAVRRRSWFSRGPSSSTPSASPSRWRSASRACRSSTRRCSAPSPRTSSATSRACTAFSSATSTSSAPSGDDCVLPPPATACTYPRRMTRLCRHLRRGRACPFPFVSAFGQFFRRADPVVDGDGPGAELGTGILGAECRLSVPRRVGGHRGSRTRGPAWLEFTGRGGAELSVSLLRRLAGLGGGSAGCRHAARVVRLWTSGRTSHQRMKMVVDDVADALKGEKRASKLVQSVKQLKRAAIARRA